MSEACLPDSKVEEPRRSRIIALLHAHAETPGVPWWEQFANPWRGVGMFYHTIVLGILEGVANGNAAPTLDNLSLHFDNLLRQYVVFSTLFAHATKGRIPMDETKPLGLLAGERVGRLLMDLATPSLELSTTKGFIGRQVVSSVQQRVWG